MFWFLDGEKWKSEEALHIYDLRKPYIREKKKKVDS